MVTNRPYGGVPSDQRVRQRRLALVEAALDLIGAGQEPTVRAVCAGAGITARYFYESFAQLDDLLVHVIDCVGEEMAQAATAAALQAPATVRDRCAAATAGAYGALAADPRKARALLEFAQGRERLRERQQAAFRGQVDALFRFVEEQGGRFTDPERARTTSLFLVGGTAQLFAASFEGTIAMSGPELVDLLVDLMILALEPLMAD